MRGGDAWWMRGGARPVKPSKNVTFPQIVAPFEMLPGACRTAEVTSVGTEPWGCAERPEMTDGYSVGIVFSAVGASIVGVGE